MLNIRVGDLLKSKAQALVNTVNCVGVMGKGIALEFKRAFPEMFADYSERCRNHSVKLGRPYPYYLPDGRVIINFPTKYHWRSPSKLNDIVQGMEFLRQNYKAWGVTSLAVPPLGCGNGQLEWRVVGPTLYAMLSSLNIDVEFYAPKGTPPDQLTLDFLANNQETTMRGTQEKIAPSWVALVSVLNRINRMSVRQPIGRIAFQKLAYFATEFGIPTGFKFRRGSYGPYDPTVKAVIGRLLNNGLVNEEPFGNMLRVTVGTTFVDAERAYSADLKTWSNTIDFLADFVSRMNTSTIEAAATVHFVTSELFASTGSIPTESKVVDEVIKWKADRFNATTISVLTRLLGTLQVIRTKGDDNLALPADDLMLA